MYCKCKSPKKKNSEANGKTFQVCSLSEGGCGEEIQNCVVAVDWTKTPQATKEYVDSIASGVELCPECEGGCFTMVCYGGMPIEKNCKHCDGNGYI